VQSGTTVRTTVANMGPVGSFTQSGTGAVTTTVQTKLRETVSVKDFGAVGDGVTDDTAAVQAAVTYCIANNKNLIVPSLCLLTSSVNIDRQVDGAAYDSYFIISGVTGGGFIVNSAISMFSSSIVFTTAPVNQLTRFENLIFQSSNSSLSAYVLNDARFLRTSFDGCSFSKIKLLSASTVYTQSIYLTGCNIRRFTGIFFNSGAYTYDFKMVNCLIEAGVNAIKIKNPVGCSFVSCTIEGQSGTAISYDGAQGLDVTGCYFEGNGLDIDGTFGGASSSNSYGVCLNGNYFSNSTTTYTVKWYNTFGCVSIGNWHTGYMHNLTGTINNLITYDIAQSSLSAQNVNIIRSGYDGTYTGTLTGCTTSPTTTLRYNKSDNVITLYIPDLTATSNSTSASITGMPSNIKPARQQICVVRAVNNGTYSFGLGIVSEVDGSISLAIDALGNGFTASGTKGIAKTTVTYSLY
jgi:hypothetical protein